MKITPTKENNTYEKVLEYLDPENNKPETETDQYKQKYSDIKFIGRQKRAAPIPIRVANVVAHHNKLLTQ